LCRKIDARGGCGWFIVTIIGIELNGFAYRH